MIAICERFHCLPSAVYDEDSGLLRMLELEALVKEVSPDVGQ